MGAALIVRAAAVAVLVIALSAVAVVLLDGGDRLLLDVRLENASQLVPGNEVKVGGLPVGSVEEIRLGGDNQAVVRIAITDEDLLPLHEGTRAWVRWSSVSGVANRYLALEPGPNDAPQLADGATIRAQDTRAAVELDAVLATLDADTRDDLQRLTRGSATTYAGRERELNAGLRALNPAVAQLDATLSELARDRDAFRRFVVSGASWVSAVADRERDLATGLGAAATTASAVARERAALDALLAAAPATLERASGTLRRTRSTLRTLGPVARAAGPVAPRTARLLTDLDPVLDRLPGALREVRPLLPALDAFLATVPAVRRTGLPALASTRSAIAATLPMVVGLREYLPDVVIGLTNGFGGTAAGPYDANGAYGRIGAVAGRFSLNGAGSLVPLPSLGYRPGNTMRCPGAGTQVAPDGSNDVRPTTPCDPEQRP